jgi:hypothetical protein
MTPQLFILVATGQNVANLPPVLETAQAGDLTVWVESAAARRGNWAHGAKQVLERYKLRLVDSLPVEEVNDPAEVVHACAPLASHWQGKARPVIVANGGNKLTPIGLLRAWEGQYPVILYGNDRPAVLWVFENGMHNPPSIRPYQRHCLDVDDILEASGHQMHDRAMTKRLWPSDHLSEDLQVCEAYANDAAATRQLHGDHAAWSTPRGAHEDMPVPFAETCRLLGTTRIDRWKRSFFPLVWAARRWQRFPQVQPNLPEDQLRFLTDLMHEQQWANQYHTTAGLIRDARTAHQRQQLRQPATTLGPPFERAVTRRLWHWLQTHDGAGVVQSAWRNVKVCRASNPALVVAEFDILLVLKNGILLHVECKTFTVPQKDLDARLLNLQQAGSSLAQMAVCAPIYTHFAQEDWFQPLHDLQQRIESVGRLSFLPLTLLGQPQRYRLSEDSGEQEFQCLSFEEALDRFISPFKAREVTALLS